jgi:hypothetical protein
MSGARVVGRAIRRAATLRVLLTALLASFDWVDLSVCEGILLGPLIDLAVLAEAAVFWSGMLVKEEWEVEL